MGVHLAAEGFKVEGFLGRHSNPEYNVIRVVPGGIGSRALMIRSYWAGSFPVKTRASPRNM